jgi:hypothetical protein
MTQSFHDIANRLLGRPLAPVPGKLKSAKRKQADVIGFRELPIWYIAIPNAIQTLEGSGFDMWDRTMVSTLLNVSTSTAVRAMRRFGAKRIGRQLVIDRAHLLNALSGIVKDSRFRVAVETMENRHRKIAALRPPPSRVIHSFEEPRTAVQTRPVSSLPDSILFEPGRCIIQAADGQSLMEQLLLIAGAINDPGLSGFDEIDSLLKG